jgi:hypothetical protein
VIIIKVDYDQQEKTTPTLASPVLSTTNPNPYLVNIGFIVTKLF